MINQFKGFVIVVIIFFSVATKAQQLGNTQTPVAEKNIYGIQAGFLGAWGYNETRLYKSLALRSEIGFDLALFGGGLIESSRSVNYALAFGVKFEPRWYYNFGKRQRKSKKIENNTGNFVAISIASNFEDLVITDSDFVTIPNQVRIVPKWGIRRTIGQHFSYELGIGLGAGRAFNYREKWEAVLDLHIRFGFDF